MNIAKASAENSRPSRTAESIAAPLRSRLVGHREQPGKPGVTEPAHANPSTSAEPGLTGSKQFRLSLPDEIVDEVAMQFWQLAGVYRPTTIVGVNAALDLAVCMWKNRRLFEQYAAHQMQLRVLAKSMRQKQAQRQAIRWFTRLSGEPRKALTQLEQLKPGLKLILGTLQNMVGELQQNEGTWSSSQFETAVNLSGFTLFELWNDVRMRRFWAAWFGTFMDKELFYEQIFRFQAPAAEYESRANEAIRTAPSPAESRATLAQWTQELIKEFEIKLKHTSQSEDELDPLASSVASWPSTQNSTQHLLHLRYAHQVDRKTLDLHNLLAQVPAATNGDAWELDSRLLPKQWRDLLMAKKPSLASSNQSPATTVGPLKPKLAESSTAPSIKTVNKTVIDLMMESVEAYLASRNEAVDAVRPIEEANVRRDISAPGAVSQTSMELLKQPHPELRMNEKMPLNPADPVIEPSQKRQASARVNSKPPIVKRRLRGDTPAPMQPSAQRTLKAHQKPRSPKA